MRRVSLVSFALLLLATARCGSEERASALGTGANAGAGGSGGSAGVAAGGAGGAAAGGGQAGTSGAAGSAGHAATAGVDGGDPDASDAADDHALDAADDHTLDAEEDGHTHDAFMEGASDGTVDVTDAGFDPRPVAGSACGAVLQNHPLAPGQHVAACSPLTFATNPPSSGAHYPYWAAYGTYAFPVPRGFLVHDLEHGAVVLHYRCASGCASEVAAAEAFIAAYPADPVCAATAVRRRILLVPDPELDVAWAASAWGRTLRASCFEPAAFAAFLAEVDAAPLAPEATVCADGWRFEVDGGVAWPPGCDDAGAPTD